jgi:general secretion pathway protein G
MLSIRHRGPVTQFSRPTTAAAFTLIELLLVVAIVGVLASLAVPKLQKSVDLARVAKAIGDIEAMQAELASLDALPTSLVAIDRATFLDPWERPYVYLKLEGPKNKGKARKDHFLVPLNSDYDLYSMGKDGTSAAPLTAKASADDVLRANNGGFIGLAARY